MKPCNCAQHGPVTTEQEAPDEWRVVCCFCWRQTDIFDNPVMATAMWNGGYIHEHQDD
jgi:hypothetical protein